MISIDAKNRQVFNATKCFQCGLIDSSMLGRIVNAKVCYELIESLFDLFSGDVELVTGLQIISRMLDVLERES